MKNEATVPSFRYVFIDNSCVAHVVQLVHYQSASMGTALAIMG